MKPPSPSFIDRFKEETDIDHHGEGKTKVQVSVRLTNILDIREVSNEITFKFQITLEWRDKRLQFLYLKDSEDMNNIGGSYIWVRFSNKL